MAGSSLRELARGCPNSQNKNLRGEWARVREIHNEQGAARVVRSRPRWSTQGLLLCCGDARRQSWPASP
eukprot:15070985-Alexandrium_andersonii.AAC.1